MLVAIDPQATRLYGSENDDDDDEPPVYCIFLAVELRGMCRMRVCDAVSCNLTVTNTILEEF